MNILGKEQPIIYQIDDVFDPRMANMVYNAQQNYINALREDYLQTDKDLKDFRKEYGDFYSPFAKDNENWDRLTNGAIREVMDKYGPDMLRSIEGRAEIQKAINSIPYGELQKLRASVQPAMQFLKNKGVLDSKGLYSKDFQNWLNKQAGITNFEDWDTLKDGVWTKESPDTFDSLNTVTHSWYDQRQALYKGMKNGNRVYSYDFNDLKNTAKANAQGFINTPRGAYEFMNIKEQLKRTNPNMSEEDLQNKAFDILDDRIAQANIEMLLPEKYEADPYALARYKADLDDRNARRAAARRPSSASSGEKNLGHSHTGESFIAGLSKTTGIPVDTLKTAVTSNDWKAVTKFMKHGQIEAIRSSKNKGSVQNVINKLVTYDDPHIISKSFGKTIGKHNGTDVSDADADRLYSPTALFNSMYGSKNVHYSKANGGDFDKLKKHKHYDANTYEYVKVPTGKTVTILCKDGRTRMFREMTVYYKQRNTNYNKYATDKQDASVGTNTYVKYNKVSTPMWYDTHATTEGGEVNPKSENFIMSPQIGSSYAPEVETNDINMGRSLGDTSSRNTSDARIF